MDSNTTPPSFPESHKPFSFKEAERAWRLGRFISLRSLTDDELIAELDDLEDEWGLLNGDLNAEDYAFYPKQIIVNGIAFLEEQLRDATREMQRRVRSTVRRSDAHESVDWQARFDAMRRADIIDALQTLGLELHKRGREWTCPCPFHEDRHFHFSASREKGVWHCFPCGKGGDLVAYWAMRSGLSRVEALKLLEALLGI